MCLGLKKAKVMPRPADPMGHHVSETQTMMKIIINLLMLKPAVKSEEPFLFNRKTSCVQFMAQFKQERNMTGLSSDCCTTFFPWSHGGPPGRAWLGPSVVLFFFWYAFMVYWFKSLSGVDLFNSSVCSENIFTCRFVGVLKELYFMFLKKKKKKK